MVEMAVGDEYQTQFFITVFFDVTKYPLLLARRACVNQKEAAAGFDEIYPAHAGVKSFNANSVAVIVFFGPEGRGIGRGEDGEKEDEGAEKHIYHVKFSFNGLVTSPPAPLLSERGAFIKKTYGNPSSPSLTGKGF
jgi:hypothetical protein